MNADIFVGLEGIVGKNMFLYCMNSYIIKRDESGTRPVFSSNEKTRDIRNSVLMMRARREPVDLTKKLTAALEKNYAYLESYLDQNTKKYGAVIAYTMTNIEFASKVKSGGDWDYKASWNLNRYQAYMFNGEIITYEDPGNINFGYVGSLIHNLTDLKTFAGEYQIISGTSDWKYFKSFFDDPADGNAITYGYLLKQGDYNTLFTSYTLN